MSNGHLRVNTYSVRGCRSVFEYVGDPGRIPHAFMRLGFYLQNGHAHIYDLSHGVTVPALTISNFCK